MDLPPIIRIFIKAQPWLVHRRKLGRGGGNAELVQLGDYGVGAQTKKPALAPALVLPGVFTEGWDH